MKAVPPRHLVRRIVAEESAIAGLDSQLVFDNDRRKPVAWVRARACKRLHAMKTYSLPGIGAALKIDHTSVLHHVRRELSETPPGWRHGDDPRKKKTSAPVYDHPAPNLCAWPVLRRPLLLPSAFAPFPMSRLMGARA